MKILSNLMHISFFGGFILAILSALGIIIVPGILLGVMIAIPAIFYIVVLGIILFIARNMSNTLNPKDD